MSATADRYAGLAASVQGAGQAEIEREQLKFGKLLLDLQTRCTERLIDYTITGVAGGRVHVSLYGVDWVVGIRVSGADTAEAIDKALDELSRRHG